MDILNRLRYICDNKSSYPNIKNIYKFSFDHKHKFNYHFFNFIEYKNSQITLDIIKKNFTSIIPSAIINNIKSYLLFENLFINNMYDFYVVENEEVNLVYYPSNFPVFMYDIIKKNIESLNTKEIFMAKIIN